MIGPRFYDVVCCGVEVGSDLLAPLKYFTIPLPSHKRLHISQAYPSVKLPKQPHHDKDLLLCIYYLIFLGRYKIQNKSDQH